MCQKNSASPLLLLVILACRQKSQIIQPVVVEAA
jgi:hypothetical protein